MADTAIPLTDITAGAASAVAEPAGTAIVAANTHTVTPPRDVAPEDIVLRVVNTTASEKDITLTAGDAPPALAGEPAAVTATLAAGDTTPTVAYIACSSKHLQSDGTLVVTVESGTTGFITALQHKRA